MYYRFADFAVPRSLVSPDMRQMETFVMSTQDQVPVPVPLAGQCRCGHIQYRVVQEPRFTFACHCTDCQQLTSSAFSLGMAVPRDGFELHGEAHCWEKMSDSGGWSRQFTCPTCAGWTHTITENSPDIVIVRTSTLHDHRWVRPVAQIFTRSALPWALMPLQFSYDTEFSDTSPLEQAFAAGGIRPRRT